MIYVNMDPTILKYHKIYILNKPDGKSKSLKMKLQSEKLKFEKMVNDLKYNGLEYKKTQKYKILFHFLYKNIEKIALANLEELQRYEKDYKRRIKKFLEDESVEVKNEFYSYLRVFFENEYNRFSKGYYIKVGDNKVLWNSYAYLKLLKGKVCPYCNAQFTLTIHRINSSGYGGPSRAELDHFLPKYDFPIFSMSIYNLVPSCKVCNQSSKNDRPTSFENNISPFDPEIVDQFYFSRQFKKNKESIKKINYVDAILAESSNFEISVSPKNNIDNKYLSEKEIDLKRKVNNNIKLFRLKTIYNYHKEYIQEHILKSRIYNELYIRQLHEDFPKIINNNEFNKMILKSPHQYNQNILSKALNDIIESEIHSQRKS